MNYQYYLLMLLLCFTATVSFSQNRFSTKKYQYTPSSYQVPPQENYTPDLSGLAEIAAKRQALYDANRDYMDGIINWIYALKNETNDTDFLAFLDKQYKKLRAFEEQDLSRLRNKIRDVELRIKEEVYEYNRKIKLALEEKQHQEELKKEQAAKIYQNQVTYSDKHNHKSNLANSNTYQTRSYTPNHNSNYNNTTSYNISSSSSYGKRQLEVYQVTESTSFRQSASSKSGVIKRFKSGDTVEVIDCSDTWWCQIKHQDNIGWIKKKLIEPRK